MALVRGHGKIAAKHRLPHGRGSVTLSSLGKSQAAPRLALLVAGLLQKTALKSAVQQIVGQPERMFFEMDHVNHV